MPSNQEVRLPQVVNDRLLLVPDYQRPYAWGLKQLADLWEDIDLLGPDGNHYAGTLVLREVVEKGSGRRRTSLADDGKTLRHCEVVDGQQRLTTCILLLDRIRRALEVLADAGHENASKVAKNLSSTYGMVGIDNAPRPRLTLGEDLNHYWVDVVLGDDTYAGPALLGGQERLKCAAAFFDTRVASLCEGVEADEKFQRLNDLQRRVTDGLGFLVYDVQSMAEVGVIFETLNERGRDLSDLEKTKNYLLYLARSIQDGRGELLAERINKAWAEIFRNLASQASDADDQLLRAHWLATENPDRSNWKRITSIKRRFDRANYISGETRLIPVARANKDQDEAWNRLDSDVTDYVNTLRKASHFLAEMLDENAAFESFSGSDRGHVLASSAALRRSQVVALYRPLLIAARLRYPQDGAFYARLVKLCEAYSARVFVIEQRRANAGEPRLLRLANNLFNGADPEEILSDVAAVLWRYAPDERVRTTLEATSENWYVRRGHKYFLYEYEIGLSGGNAHDLPALSFFTDASQEQRTTEHVLPQHPKVETSTWWDYFSEEDHSGLVHSLGNLALTYDNSSYSNFDFERKRGLPLGPGEEPKPCYAQGRLAQERRLAQYEQWNPTVIAERQAELAQWALTRWAITSPAGADLDVETDGMESEGSEDDMHDSGPE